MPENTPNAPGADADLPPRADSTPGEFPTNLSLALALVDPDGERGAVIRATSTEELYRTEPKVRFQAKRVVQGADGMTFETQSTELVHTIGRGNPEVGGKDFEAPNITAGARDEEAEGELAQLLLLAQRHELRVIEDFLDELRNNSAFNALVSTDSTRAEVIGLLETEVARMEQTRVAIDAADLDGDDA